MSLAPLHNAESVDHTQFWLKLKAKDVFARSLIANTGASIERVEENFVYAIANLEEKHELEKLNLVVAEENFAKLLDFPDKDRDYHNYTEMQQALEVLANQFPDLVRVGSIGTTAQGRDIWAIRISTRVDFADSKPAVLYLGGHHAREHLSVEIPLRFAQWLLNEYKNNNPRIVRLITGRDIHIIPMVNPDGLEYDVEGARYKAWRKNRSQNRDGTYGVDLNRNYGYQWGTGGSSRNTNSETYMGPAPFSELETQAIKTYIESHTNISTLLSFHTFSELILYPWGHKYDSVSNSQDKAVYEKMGKQMATWNNYTPEQASALYIASGDLTDWSYGAHRIFSFTFELDPSSSFGGGSDGFYPGQGVIPQVLQKNIEPCLYLMEYADNPYRVLESNPIF